MEQTINWECHEQRGIQAPTAWLKQLQMLVSAVANRQHKLNNLIAVLGYQKHKTLVRLCWLEPGGSSLADAGGIVRQAAQQWQGQGVFVACALVASGGFTGLTSKLLGGNMLLLVFETCDRRVVLWAPFVAGALGDFAQLPQDLEPATQSLVSWEALPPIFCERDIKKEEACAGPC